MSDKKVRDQPGSGGQLTPKEPEGAEPVTLPREMVEEVLEQMEDAHQRFMHGNPCLFRGCQFAEAMSALRLSLETR